MSTRVFLRAKSGPRIGQGHVMRTRAVAEELLARGAEAVLIVDDEASARRLRAAGFDAWAVLERAGWAREGAAGAWLDGFADWTEDLRALARRGTPSYLVENRTAAREWASFIVQPKLYVDEDPWERVHAARILRGPAWIPLLASVRAVRPAARRELDLLVTFGGSDPLHSTERVLAALPAGLAVAVSVGWHMEGRRAAIERAARHLAAEVLPAQTALAPWMARSRAAISALGTTLFELAYLRTPALVLANYAEDRPVLAAFPARGPFHALGLARELAEVELAASLARILPSLRAPSAAIPGLGEGAARLAQRLLARTPAPLAA